MSLPLFPSAWMSEEHRAYQDMVARYMPHVEYRGRPKATVSPYFGYFSAVKM